MSKTLVIIVLILIIIGLWYYDEQTKWLITGAFSYAKSAAANAGIIK